MFELRGRSKERILEALRARRLGDDEPAMEPLDRLPDEQETDHEGMAPRFDDSIAAFWIASTPLDEVELSFVEPVVDALAVKRLGAPPFWLAERPFNELMEQAYRAIGKQALRLALGDDSR